MIDWLDLSIVAVQLILTRAILMTPTVTTAPIVTTSSYATAAIQRFWRPEC